MSERWEDVEKDALIAERSIDSNPNRDAALEAAIRSAELYMKALKLTDSPSGRKRLGAKTKELLIKAESIKTRKDGLANPYAFAYQDNAKLPESTQSLTTREKIILLEGSKLHGTVFKPWNKPPSHQEFTLSEGDDLYVDPWTCTLSDVQVRSFAGWERPKQALSRIKLDAGGLVLDNEPSMAMTGRLDLVQDLTSDCSVVASLCVGTARAEQGHRKMMDSIMYPYDLENSRVALSPNGKYILRLYFNGCWRRVEIDDLLPASSTSRVLHVVNRSNPGLLWPALFEKAYLKVRGGYDFPGSNSGTDLTVLIGWIPQQVFLHDEDVEAGGLWEELIEPFGTGDILLTMGTGKLSKREQRQLGLAAEHDYAVLDMKDLGGLREFLIKNPWVDGDVWKGTVRRRPNPCHQTDQDEQDATRVTNNESEPMLPGTFWMDVNSVFQHFEHLYINWNPCRFSHRVDSHFTWTTPELPPVPNILADNPQFMIKPGKEGELWLQLNRHFRTGDYTSANSGKNGYIGLYLYERGGTRVLSSPGAEMRGPLVDSPNTLLRFHAQGSKAYTAVVVMQELPRGKHNFTISAFSNGSATLEQARQQYEQIHSTKAAWTRPTAGGSSDCPRYLQNPQFSVSLTSDTSLALLLRLLSDPTHPLDETDIHVKILVVSSDGRRVTKLRSRDIVAHSGDYRRGSAVIETFLPTGTYSVICSTFDPNQLAKFQLDLQSSSSCPSSHHPVLSLIPSENSGRLTVTTRPAFFTEGINKVVAPVTVDRITKAIFIASQIQMHNQSRLSNSASRTGAGAESQLFKLSLEQGQGPYKNILATSATETAEYGSIASAVRIEDIGLNPSLTLSSNVKIRGLQGDGGGTGLWLVLERPAQLSSNAFTNGRGYESSVQIVPPLVIEVEILTQERIDVGDWSIIGD